MIDFLYSSRVRMLGIRTRWDGMVLCGAVRAVQRALPIQIDGSMEALRVAWHGWLAVPCVIRITYPVSHLGEGRNHFKS